MRKTFSPSLTALALAVLTGCSGMQSIQDITNVATTNLSGTWEGEYKCPAPRWVPHPAKAVVTFNPGLNPLTFTGTAHYELTDYRTGHKFGGVTEFQGITKIGGGFEITSERFTKRYGPGSAPGHLHEPRMKGQMVGGNHLQTRFCDTTASLYRKLH
jgi:hypothetical protein